MNEVMIQINQVAGNGLMLLQNTVVLAVTIAIGVIIGLFGLKLARVWSALVGLVLGVGAGAIVSITAGLTGMTSVAVIAGGGVLFAVLACIFYKVGMFFFVWMIVFGMGMTAIGEEILVPVMIICAVLGLILGIITLKFFDPLVIILTSLYGGILAGSAAVSLVRLNDFLAAVLAVPAVLFVIFMAVQFIMRSRQVGKKQVKQAGERRKRESREAEVEQARMLLDDELEDLDDLDDEGDDPEDLDDLADAYDLNEEYDDSDDELDEDYDDLDLDDDFQIIE